MIPVGFKTGDQVHVDRWVGRARMYASFDFERRHVFNSPGDPYDLSWSVMCIVLASCDHMVYVFGRNVKGWVNESDLVLS